MGQWLSCSLASRVNDHTLLLQELYHAVPRQGGSTMAVDADHLLVRDEGVDHGLLSGQHRGLVEGIKEAPGNEAQLVIAAFSGMERAESRGAGSWTGG